MPGNRRIWIGLGIVVLLGVGVWLAVRGAGDRAVEVRTEVAESRDLAATITATGSIRPRRQVNISSDVMGRVVELNVEEGDEVERGVLLLRIDPTTSEAQVARARAALSQSQAQVSQALANLEQARRDLDRLLNLSQRDPNLVSLQALEEARTRLQIQESTLESAEFGAAQTRAQLEESEEQRSRTTIVSPISGRVTRLNIEEGETVVIGTMNNPGSLLLTVSDLSVIEAVLTVDETDVPRISLGDSAVVEIDAFPGQPFAGRVSRIGNSAIQPAQGQSRTSVDFEVVLTLLDPPEALRPDLSATADIIVDRRPSVLSVPIIAVTVREDSALVRTAAAPGDATGNPRSSAARSAAASRRQEGVFVVRDGRAHWTPVELGITGEEHFEIVSGLSPGDVVVSGPYQRIQELSDGAAVTVEASGRPRPR
ncbi:MAG: efflux RND transporter periplasmic adaptor subunit [Gemmatimonadales bacterium]|nr:MAG: efflux RND transporter periplasmic adaptor subunit [Gemmatimonadales bacterium]